MFKWYLKDENKASQSRYTSYSTKSPFITEATFYTRLASKIRQFNSKYLKLLREKSCYRPSSDRLGAIWEVIFSNSTVNYFILL